MLPHPLVAQRPAALPRHRYVAALGTLALALALASGPARAQDAPAAEPAPAATASLKPEAPPDYSKPMGPLDPFNRGTPQGSVYGFTTAAEAGDFDTAAEHLDLRRLPRDQWQTEGPRLARELQTVIDQTLVIDFQHLAPDNDGTPNDGLPAWQDRLGTIDAASGQVELLLQRVPRAKDSVRIWKISAITLDKVPALYAEFGYAVLEQYLPDFFFEVSLFNVELWQWIGLLLVIFAAWLISWLFATVLLRLLGRLMARTDAPLDSRIVNLVRNPVRLLLGVLLFHALVVPIDLPLPARDPLLIAQRALVVTALAWLLLQLIDLAALAMQQRIERDDPGAAALISPTRKTVKVLIVALATLFMIDNLGYNVGALLAGLGVGGIAVALAAQKTVEHFFGGVTLVADQPIRVGDFCKFGDKIGTVEQIGLRSTRIRTLDRTVVTVPNAEFSNLQIENFAERDQIRLHTVLGLRYETTPEQLRYVLAQLRELLLAHPKLDPDPARVRFVGFGAYSLDLEVYVYARTADWDEFLQIREDVLLRMMDVVAEAGSGFAFPSSTTYVGRDVGLDEQQAQMAEDRVAAWRNDGELPFPQFANERRAELEDSLDWPPEGSTGRPRQHPPVVGTDES